MSSSSLAPFEALLQRINPAWRVRQAVPMTGGVSAQVTALEVERPDAPPLKLIVRQHGAIDRAINANIARDEHRLLTIAHARGLVVPKPYYVDESCDLFENPVVVIAYIEGDTDFEPADRASYLSQMARALARIHTVRDSRDLAFLPERGSGYRERSAAPDESLSESRIRDALEAHWPLTQVNVSVLLHGDYWPGNLLWQDGALAAVIDWEDAVRGDPLSDLAIARIELLFFLNDDAMHAFTRLYLDDSPIDTGNLPYWDLCAALRYCGKLSSWGLEADQEQRMRERHAWFVEDALHRLPAT